MAEKAKEQASQLGEAAFSGAGNIAAATGLVKKEEFPADLKVRPPCHCHAHGEAGTSPGLAESPSVAPQPHGRDPEGPHLLCLCPGQAGVAAPSVPAACAAAADVCVRGILHGGRRRGAGGASLQRLRGDLTAAGAEGWGGAAGSHLTAPMSRWLPA